MLALNQSVEDLAAKTFYPERIVVSGTSDDFGLGVTPIGGTFQRYYNDFKILGGGHTVGTSVFLDSEGEAIASGQIDTQNYFDAITGEVVYADSTITLPQGSLYRHSPGLVPSSESPIQMAMVMSRIITCTSTRKASSLHAPTRTGRLPRA